MQPILIPMPTDGEPKSLNVAKLTLAATGLFIATFILLISVIAIQGMSGRDTIRNPLLFFTISFAIAFGLGAASVIALTGRYKIWAAVRTFAISGGVGGALLTISVKVIVSFDAQLRVLTRGGPLGSFLFAAMFVSIALPILVGTALLRRAEAHKSSR
jgi:hypothetical protein